MRRFSTALLAAGGLVMATAPAVPADAPHIVPAHQHNITTPGGTHQIGPPRCDNPATAQGFSGFHQNVHFGTPNQEAFANESNPVSFAARACPVP